MYTEEIDTISDIRNNPKHREASVSLAARPVEAPQPARLASTGRTRTWATAPVGLELAVA